MDHVVYIRLVMRGHACRRVKPTPQKLYLIHKLLM